MIQCNAIRPHGLACAKLLLFLIDKVTLLQKMCCNLGGKMAEGEEPS